MKNLFVKENLIDCMCAISNDLRQNNHELPLTCVANASSSRLTCPLHLFRKALVMSVLLLSVCVGNAWGTEVTLTFTTDAGRAALSPVLPAPSKANSTSALTAGTTYTCSGINISVTKGKSSNTPSIFWKDNTSVTNGNTDLRIYREKDSGTGLSGNTITISSSNTIGINNKRL